MVVRPFEMKYLWFIFNQVILYKSSISNLHVILIRLGRQEAFRSEINHDESPIENFKVSHSKFVDMIAKNNHSFFVFWRNYLIILFRDQPFELWDLKTFTLIRRLPKKCPKILALVYRISSVSIITHFLFFRIGHRMFQHWKKLPKKRQHRSLVD